MKGARQQLVEADVMGDDFAIVPAGDVDCLASLGGLLELQIDALGLGSTFIAMTWAGISVPEMRSRFQKVQV